jgi:opacity protein-like surface antigen
VTAGYSTIEGSSGMRFKEVLLLLGCLFATTMAVAQNFEITPFIGGQLNGGLDVSAGFINRIEVQNNVNYGVSAGYLLGEHAGVEFMWNHNSAGTLGQFASGGSSVKVFNLRTNQYLGNILYHLSDRETKMRPFIMFGLGGTNLSPDNGAKGITRFAWALGAGAKYNFNHRFGMRVQGKWSPSYITTTSGGFWCDPFFGCWEVGNDHFLHEFDITGGLTLRF